MISLTQKAHDIAAEFFSKNPPRCAVDATLGNGRDAFFALNVLRAEKVFGFDVQADALARSRRLADSCAYASRSEFFLGGHERMKEFIPEEFFGKIDCFFFNLGWLPSSDKKVVTRSDTTVAALSAAAEIADASRCLFSALCYRGHAGGAEEFASVLEFFEKNFAGCHETFGDASNAASPVLLAAKFLNCHCPSKVQKLSNNNH